MPTSRSLLLITTFALGAVALSASSGAFAQGYGSRYGGHVEYDDEDGYGAPVPPRPIPDYRRGTVETVVTTTRRIVTSRPSDHAYEPEDDVAVRRVIVPAPRRAYPVDGVITTGSIQPRPYYSRQPVYKSEPVYAPAPKWREVYIGDHPKRSAQPVIIEERRVETTRRILAPVPLD